MKESDPDEFIPERFVRGDPDPTPWVIIWLALVVVGVIWFAQPTTQKENTMAMSDCPKCWETPCVCGHDYRRLSVERRISLAAAVLGVPAGVLTKAVDGIVPAVHPKREEEP